MAKIHHLTDKELIDQLTLRDDLTELEHELLDRLIRNCDVLQDIQSRLDQSAASAPMTQMSL